MSVIGVKICLNKYIVSWTYHQYSIIQNSLIALQISASSVHPSPSSELLETTILSTFFMVCLSECFVIKIRHYLAPFTSAQFSSVTQSCLTLCNPMNHSTPGLPVHRQFLESTQTHVHWVGNAIQPSHPMLSPFSSCPQSLPASRSFQMSQLFTSSGQSIGVSASISILPMNTRD